LREFGMQSEDNGGRSVGEGRSLLIPSQKENVKHQWSPENYLE